MGQTAVTFNHRKIRHFFKRNNKLELPERYEYYLMILKEMVHLKPGRLFGVVLAVFEVEFPDLEHFFGKMKSSVKTCDILLDLHSELEGSYKKICSKTEK